MENKYAELIRIWEANDGDDFTQNIIYDVLEIVGEAEKFDEYRNDIYPKSNRYKVEYHVSGYYDAFVNAITEDHARDIANDVISKQDFGKLRSVCVEEIGVKQL